MTRFPSPIVRTKSFTGGVSRACPARVRWYNRISESPTLLLRLEASLFTADSVSPGVGVDDRVEGLDVGGNAELSVSFASRILVGKLVNKS